MLLLNGMELHRRVVAAASRVSGVFFGHIHQALQFHRDGLLYSAAPSAFAQLGGLPDDAAPRAEIDEPPGYQLVQLEGTEVVVRVASFPRPNG
jgi:hypothetical protein